MTLQKGHKVMFLLCDNRKTLFVFERDNNVVGRIEIPKNLRISLKTVRKFVQAEAAKHGLIALPRSLMPYAFDIISH